MRDRPDDLTPLEQLAEELYQFILQVDPNPEPMAAYAIGELAHSEAARLDGLADPGHPMKLIHLAPALAPIPARSRQGDPTTSALAAESVTASTTVKAKVAVLDSLRDNPQGLTDEELVDWIRLRYPGCRATDQRTRTCPKQLVDADWVEASHTETNIRNRTVTVWRSRAQLRLIP